MIMNMCKNCQCALFSMAKKSGNGNVAVFLSVVFDVAMPCVNVYVNGILDIYMYV